LEVIAHALKGIKIVLVGPKLVSSKQSKLLEKPGRELHSGHMSMVLHILLLSAMGSSPELKPVFYPSTSREK
jgi:hypothetical protein